MEPAFGTPDRECYCSCDCDCCFDCCQCECDCRDNLCGHDNLDAEEEEIEQPDKLTIPMFEDAHAHTG